MLRRTFLKASLTAGTALLLPPARAHEYFTANFTLIHPWTRASAPGATSAMVCMTFDDVIESDRLIGASSMVAESAEMGGPGAGSGILIPKGAKTELSEAGMHVRLLRLKFPLAIAREYPMNLVFEKAGTLRATFLVDYEAAA
jgi:hypothetical protein